MADLRTLAATASWIGHRDRQEDAVLAQLSDGNEAGLVVLSDGMGGHDDGDIASRAIVSGMLGELIFAAARPGSLRAKGTEVLTRALEAANTGLRARTEDGSGQPGMGGTMVTGVFLDGWLRWISVGDSPLYLFRGGAITRLNADHSLAPQIDLMASQGAMSPEDALSHPQRSVLTSALTGGPVAKVDCPEEALVLEAGDVVLFASDGIAALSDAEIAAVLRLSEAKGPQAMADRLVASVMARAAPDQDNVALAVVAVAATAAEPRTLTVPRRAGLRQTLTRLRNPRSLGRAGA